MHKIDGPGATQDGRFTDGDPAAGIPPTIVQEDWLNAVQDEILNVLAEAGIAPEKANNAQLKEAILKLGPERFKGFAKDGQHVAFEGDLNSIAHNSLYACDSAKVQNAPELPAGTWAFVHTMVLPADAGRAQVCWPADDPDHPGWNRRRATTGQWSDWKVVGSGSAGVLPGLIEIFPMVAIPPRRLKCNGAAISRTAYAELFAAIGTTYGEGDGSLTFNIPDLRGEFVRGWDDGRGVDAGRTLGSAQADSVRSHTHTGRLSHAWGGTNNDTGSNRVALGGTTTSGYPTLVIDAFGGAETRSRNVALIFTIAY